MHRRRQRQRRSTLTRKIEAIHEANRHTYGSPLAALLLRHGGQAHAGGLDRATVHAALLGGNVNDRGAHIKPRICHDLRGSLGVRQLKICGQRLLACADPPGEGLANRTRPNDDDNPVSWRSTYPVPLESSGKVEPLSAATAIQLC